MNYDFQRQQASEEIFIHQTKSEPGLVNLCIQGHRENCVKSMHTDLMYHLHCCCKCHELERLTR